MAIFSNVSYYKLWQCCLQYRGGVAQILIVFVSISVVFTSSAYALKESRLWLSPKYKYLMPTLVAAATQAESYPACVEIIDGQLDKSRSTVEKPIFRIICRDGDGRSFLVRATGKEGDEIEGMREEKPKPKNQAVGGGSEQSADAEPDAEAELAKQLAVEKEFEEAEEADLPMAAVNPIEGWETCLKGIEEKTKNMMNKVIYDDPPPEQKVNRFKESVYKVDFDAQNLRGATLQYQAICKVLTSGLYKVVIVMRKTKANKKRLPPKGRALNAEPSAGGKEPSAGDKEPSAKKERNNKSLEGSNVSSGNEKPAIIKKEQKVETVGFDKNKKPAVERSTSSEWQVLDNSSIVRAAESSKKKSDQSKTSDNSEDGWIVVEE